MNFKADCRIATWGDAAKQVADMKLAGAYFAIIFSFQSYSSI